MFQFDSDAAPEPLDASEPASAAVAPIVATDGERLMRFRRHSDEAALAEVVEAHAAMVWGVCSQILRRRQDVEDAFQATFLILARKAHSIRAADSAAGWLYRVAFRTSLLVRGQQRRRGERPLIEDPACADDQLAKLARHDQCLKLLEELHALPQRYRQTLVLCYLEGRSRREAADELGVTVASVKGLLARGTRLLRTRMVSRGAALSTAMAAMSGAIASASSSAMALPSLTASTVALAASFAVKSTLKSFGGAFKGSVAVTLAQKGIVAMTLASATKPAAVLLAVGLTTGMWAAAAAEKPEAKDRSAGAVARPVLLADADAPLADAKNEAASELDVEVQPSTTSRESTEGVAVRLGQSNAEVPQRQLAPGTGVDVMIPPGGTLLLGDTAPRPVEVMQDAPRLGLAPPVQGQAESGEASNAAVNLEIDYWNLKAGGLEKKAAALETKATRLQGTDAASDTEILEMQAEAELTRAEVKLCQSNALRLKESLELRDTQRAAGMGATGSSQSAQLPAQQSNNQNPPANGPTAGSSWAWDTLRAANPQLTGTIHYGTPQPPVPAALPWTSQPGAALPSDPTLLFAPTAPQRNNEGTRETPAPAPATNRPPTTVAAALTGWSIPTPVLNADSPEEMKRKFDATRAANSQLSDAQHLYSFVLDRIAELQPAQAWHDPNAYQPPRVDGEPMAQPVRPPMLEAPATYPVPPMLEAQTIFPAMQPVLEASDTAKELAKLKKENAALKKQLKDSEASR